MEQPIRVLMITTAWPDPGQPRSTHFVKRQADFVGRSGVDLDVYAFQGAKNPLNYARAWLDVRRRLRRRRYDLVHAQFGQSGLAALPKRLPMVVTMRGSDLLGIVGKNEKHTWIGRINAAVSRLVARRADAVVVVSGHMKEHLPEGVSATVLPSGLDLELFAPISRAEARERLDLPPDRTLVLFAGNPDVPRKRYSLAVETMEQVQRSLPAELVVAWGIEHTDMPLYMSACDALLFTSMQEGSPNVVKEALACNLPVVSVDVGDVRERLAGIDGCAIAPDEPAALGEALVRVLRRGGRIQGRERVIDLDEHAITRQLLGIYRSILPRERAGGAVTRTEVATGGLHAVDE